VVKSEIPVTEEGCLKAEDFYDKYMGPFQRGGKTDADRCCYSQTQENCEGGRPFLVDRIPRLPELVVSGSLHPMRASRDGDPRLNAALAEAWAMDARVEYASVAAFARLTLQLMALGAPGELVAEAQRASLDEVRHAQYCLERARHYSGMQLEFGPLQIDHCLDATDLAALVECNVIEGCVSESFAAYGLRARARLAEDPRVAEALASIAEDEAQHALLAFRILDWALERDPARMQAVAARALAHCRPGRPARAALRTTRRWAAHGRVAPADARRLHARTFHDTVAPAVVQLLERAS
jgi:hypothetical protein